MSKFLLAVHTGDADLRRPMTPEEMRRGFEQVDAVEHEMQAVDALLFSRRLLPADPDREAALTWATKVSLAIQTPIEVRPFAEEYVPA